MAPTDTFISLTPSHKQAITYNTTHLPFKQHTFVFTSSPGLYPSPNMSPQDKLILTNLAATHNTTYNVDHSIQFHVVLDNNRKILRIRPL
jgi:hypothetical protein